MDHITPSAAAKQIHYELKKYTLKQQNDIMKMLFNELVMEREAKREHYMDLAEDLDTALSDLQNLTGARVISPEGKEIRLLLPEYKMASNS